MNWIVANMKWVMLISGALTFTMIYAAIAPQAALRSTFGEALDGPLAEIVVRNWGALVALVGAMLIYGAFSPASRPLVLTVAGIRSWSSSDWSSTMGSNSSASRWAWQSGSIW